MGSESVPVGPAKLVQGVAACIVHYKDPAAVSTLLSSMKDWSLQPSVVVVVDNSGCLDPDLDIHPYIDARRAVVVDPGANVGYAAAANLGIKVGADAGCEYLLMLTQDASLEKHAAERLLVAGQEGDDIAAVGPLLALSSDPSRVFSAGGLLKSNGTPVHIAQGGALVDGTFDRRDVDWMDGACLLLRVSSVTQVGLFAEEYFLYVEEVDLMHRLRRAGFRVVIEPKALAFQEPGNFTQYLRARNFVYFQRRFRSDFKRGAFVHLLASEVLVALKKQRFTSLSWCLRGLFDGIRGRMGEPPRGVLRR